MTITICVEKQITDFSKRDKTKKTMDFDYFYETEVAAMY